MKKEDKEILRKAREREAQVHTQTFIAEYPNALDNGCCDKLMQYADNCLTINTTLNRSQPQGNTETSRRKDWFLFIHNLKDFAIPINAKIIDIIQNLITTVDSGQPFFSK